MIIAIDGPAASGKGTLARRLARRYGLNHLDTGLAYRAVAAALASAGAPLDDEEEAVRAAERLDFATLDPQDLATPGIGEAASRVALLPELRDVLVRRQREFAMSPPGAVLDGRDVGTVICPNASVKLFVTAASAARARRRIAELAARGETVDFDVVLADIERRDARDTNRPVGPLKPALDAHLLDTSEMDIEAAFRAAVDIVEKAVARG